MNIGFILKTLLTLNLIFLGFISYTQNELRLKRVFLYELELNDGSQKRNFDFSEISNNGKNLLVGINNNAILFDISKKEQIISVKYKVAKKNYAGFFNDANFFFIASDSVKYYDFKGNLLFAHNNKYGKMYFSEFSKNFIYSDRDSIYLFDYNSEKIRKINSEKNDLVFDIYFINSFEYILSYNDIIIQKSLESNSIDTLYINTVKPDSDKIYIYVKGGNIPNNIFQEYHFTLRYKNIPLIIPKRKIKRNIETVVSNLNFIGKIVENVNEAFLVNDSLLITNNLDSINFWDFVKRKKVNGYKFFNYGKEKYLFTFPYYDTYFKLIGCCNFYKYDLNSYNQIRTYYVYGNRCPITEIKYFINESFILVKCGLKHFIYNAESGKVLYTFDSGRYFISHSKNNDIWMFAEKTKVSVFKSKIK